MARAGGPRAEEARDGPKTASETTEVAEEGCGAERRRTQHTMRPYLVSTERGPVGSGRCWGPGGLDGFEWDLSRGGIVSVFW